MVGRFLDWFERHKFGVVGTLMLHTFMLFALAIFKLPPENEAQPPPELVMEMAQPLDLPPDPLLQAPQVVPAEEVTNRVSNDLGETRPVRLYPGQAAQERMAVASEEELAAEEAALFDSLARKRKAEGKEVQLPELDSSKWDPKKYLPEKPIPIKVEGNTTVRVVFVGEQRADMVLKVPAYLCVGQGLVVIDITVDGGGAVRKAVLNEARTNTVNECMREHALASAAGASFTSGAGTQRATVTYTFLAQ